MRYKGIDLVEHEGDWYFENLELAASHDPKGAESEKRRAWMDKAGAADTSAHLCLGKVVYGRRHTCGHMAGFGTRDKPVCEVTQRKRHEWFDHACIFWLPGKRQYVLTAQPYDVSLDKYQEMERFAAENGLSVEISLEDAWWYPGRTPLIVWRANEQAI